MMSGTNIDVKKSSVPTESPPNRWKSFRTEIDNLFERFDDVFQFPSIPRLFKSEPSVQTFFEFNAPAVDVVEDDSAYKITAELPGLSEKDIEVSLAGNTLVLKGEKQQEREEKDKNYHISERSYGSFQRLFRLPEGVDSDKVDANFAKGVLTITLPKTAEAKQQQRKIAIKTV
jgi:HSP20 family protein